MSKHGVEDSALVKRAGSYARKSDPNEQGVLDQHEFNRARAKRDGYAIPNSREYRYGDDGVSGVTTSRREWDRLVALVESGEAPFERLYVKDKTRLGRWSDPRLHTYWEVHFEQHGVRIIYGDRPHQIDYSDPDPGDSMLGAYLGEQVGNVTATQEHKMTRWRIMIGIRRAVMRGYYPGSTPPYATERWLADAKSGRLIEHVPAGRRIRAEDCRYKLTWAQDGSIDVVRRIFDRIEDGQSLAAVAQELTDAGTPTAGQSEAWSPEMVRRIARNPLYMGDLIWGRGTREGDPVDHTEATDDGSEPIRYRDFLPHAPISRHQWESVQAVLDGTYRRWHKRRATSPDFLLSGLLRCTHCGRGWHGHTSSARNGTTRRRYYRHEVDRGDAAAAACPSNNRYLRASMIEDQVLKVILPLLGDKRLRRLTEQALEDKRSSATSEDYAGRLAKAKRELRRKEDALDRATRAQMESETEAERQSAGRIVGAYAQEVEHLAGRVRDLASEQERLALLETKLDSMEKRVCDLRAVLREAGLAERKDVLSQLIKAVAIDVGLTSAMVHLRAL